MNIDPQVVLVMFYTLAVLPSAVWLIGLGVVKLGGIACRYISNR